MKWTTLVKIDGGNVLVNRAGIAMLQAQLTAGSGPVFEEVRPEMREAVAV